jgi:hypothetical protein
MDENLRAAPLFKTLDDELGFWKISAYKERRTQTK